MRQYILPKFLFQIEKPTAVNYDATIALFPINGNYQYFNFEIFAAPYYTGNTRMASCQVELARNYLKERRVNCYGSCQNPREIVLNGESWLAIDFTIQQYGYVDFYIRGIHENISLIREVTGSFSE